MDAIKVNRNVKTYGFVPVSIRFMQEIQDRVLVVFNERVNHKIDEDDFLWLRRYIYGSNPEECEVMTDKLRILECKKYEEDGHSFDAVYVEVPKIAELTFGGKYGGYLSIREDNYEDCKDYGQAYFDPTHGYMMVRVEDYVGSAATDGFYIDDRLYYHGGDDEYFMMRFMEQHNIFAQDIAFANETIGEYVIDVADANRNIIGTLMGLSIPITGTQLSVTSANTLTYNEIETCHKYDQFGSPYDVKVYDYTYLPDRFSRRTIKFTSASTSQMDGSFYDTALYLIENGEFYYPRYNPYLYDYIDAADNNKKYNGWKDPWWPAFEEKNEISPLVEMYVNKGNSRVEVGLDLPFINVPMLSFSSDDYGSVGMDDEMATTYVEDIISRSMPETIDMERIKYVPAIEEDDEMKPVTSITLDFHFRKRAEIDENEEDFPIYKEGWYIDADSAATVWWNGFEYEEPYFSSSDFSDYMEESGKTSDLIGYLDFTDSDIMFQKSKVSQTFVRFSFYTSPDPVEQKLLFYSTVFLDGTALYGKFMKQYVLRNNENRGRGIVRTRQVADKLPIPLVFYDNDAVSARLDTEIVIRDEYQNLMSSEGFNLYLFADDADKKDEGKEYRTIYMKIEFNHAGNGKTIPMILWPKDGEAYKPLTVENFLESMFIPVHIGFYNGKFMYSLPTADNEDNNIRLILFEPKLDTDGNI